MEYNELKSKIAELEEEISILNDRIKHLKYDLDDTIIDYNEECIRNRELEDKLEFLKEEGEHEIKIYCDISDQNYGHYREDLVSLLEQNLKNGGIINLVKHLEKL